MSKTFKQVKLYMDFDQEATIQYGDTSSMIQLHLNEDSKPGEEGYAEYLLYLSQDNAITLGEELINFANRMKDED